MALNKNIPTDYGVDAAYWRIMGAQMYYSDSAVDIVLAGYASASARDAGKAPLATMTGIRLSWDDMGLDGDAEPTRTTMYNAIKMRADSGDERLAILAGSTDG